MLYFYWFFLSTQSQDQYEIQRSLTILTYWYTMKNTVWDLHLFAKNPSKLKNYDCQPLRVGIAYYIIVNMSGFSASLHPIDIFGQIILCFVRYPIGWKIAVSLVSSHQKLVAYFAPNVTFKNVSRHCQIFPQYKIVHSWEPPLWMTHERCPHQQYLSLLVTENKNMKKAQTSSNLHLWEDKFRLA